MSGHRSHAIEHATIPGMNVQSSSTETFSFSGLLTRHWRLLHIHELQWFRPALEFVAGIHLTPNVGKLYWHYSTHHTPSVLPDFLAVLLSVAARFIWNFLFRNPAVFLGFKRPGRTYRWVVFGTVVLTTVPNGLVHIWALKMALKKKTIVPAGVITSYFAIVFMVPLIGFVYWMAHKFLLKLDESNEEFEPVVKDSRFATAAERQYLTPGVEPYTDNISIASTCTGVTNRHLSQAYEEQRPISQEPPADQSSNGPAETPQLEGQHAEEIEEMEQRSNEALNAAPTINETNPTRCQTLARFEYMSQRHSGVHSWFSYPLMPLILSTYATILLILLPIWIHEDRQYKLRAPSPTIKKTFYMPLGMYLLSFYALKHRIRASLFERFNIPYPGPWRKLFSFFPSWAGTGCAFKNVDTGEVTMYDPRRRAFPCAAYHQPAIIRTSQYLSAYNASQGTCTTFWGHYGRNVRTEVRFRPTIYRVGFVFFAIYFTLKGYWQGAFYNVPNVYEEILKHPKLIKAEDILRIMRLIKFWQAFSFSGVWFMIVAITFGGACAGSMSVLFFHAVWKYVPQEDRDRIAREGQAWEQERERDRERERERER